MVLERDLVSLENLNKHRKSVEVFDNSQIPKRILYVKEKFFDQLRFEDAISAYSNCSVSTKDETSTTPESSYRRNENAVITPRDHSNFPLIKLNEQNNNLVKGNGSKNNENLLNNLIINGTTMQISSENKPITYAENYYQNNNKNGFKLSHQANNSSSLTENDHALQQFMFQDNQLIPSYFKNTKQNSAHHEKLNNTEITTTTEAILTPSSQASFSTRRDGWNPALIDLFSDKKSNRLLSPNFKLEFGSNEFFTYLLQLPPIDLAYLARITARYRRRSRADNNKSTIVSVNLCGCETPHTAPISKLDTYENFYVHYKNPNIAQNLCDAARSVILVELHTDLDVAEFLERRLPVMVRRQVGNKLNENFVVQIFNITFLKEHLAGNWCMSDLPECSQMDMDRLRLHPLYQHMLAEVHRRQSLPVFRNLNLCAVSMPQN